ncbi:MAG: tRNA lysidine(34) synthetase TilS [Bryobacterales bacterium]|nr:tRNA lysidine(34) synthetase TilS [Bryobacterales bacterium]
MLDRVLETALRHGMFSPGDRVGVAVSGGADSVCLLHALLDLRGQWKLRLSVVHIDHQLRGQASVEDAAFVEALAHNHDLPFHLERVDVASQAAGCRENLEQVAREARLRLFRRLRGEGLVDKIATGHTQSDQAETVLFRFLRGSGTSGLAGILPVTEDGIVRPLLGVTRAEVVQFLGASGIRWRTDETNSQTAFVRNRIRLELLPLLEREYNPAILAQLAQTAEIAREEESYWSPQIAALANDIFGIEDGAVVFPCSRFAGLPRAVGRRLLRFAFSRVKGDLRQIEFQHVESALGLAAGAEGHGRVQIPGLDIIRSFEWLRIGPLESGGGAHCPDRMLLNVPGDTHLPRGGVRIRTTLAPGPASESGYNEEQASEVSSQLLDWDKVRPPLTLRYWSPGDAYRRAGAREQEKIKQMFQLARIPLWQRRFWPMIESDQGIVWARRFGPSSMAAPTAGSRCLLRIEELLDGRESL